MENNPYDAITKFIFVENRISEAQIIFIAGGSRRELIDRAIELYNNGVSKYILPSGGPNSKIPDAESEWQFMHDIAVEAGIPEDAILKESIATNTFENARLSRRVLDRQQMKI